jgi:hypothetical protein
LTRVEPELDQCSFHSELSSNAKFRLMWSSSLSLIPKQTSRSRITNTRSELAHLHLDLRPWVARWIFTSYHSFFFLLLFLNNVNVTYDTRCNLDKVLMWWCVQFLNGRWTKRLKACLGVVLYFIIFEKIDWVGFSM